MRRGGTAEKLAEEKSMRSFKFFLWATISILAVLCVAVSSHAGMQQPVAMPVSAPAPLASPAALPMPMPEAEPLPAMNDDEDEMPLKEQETVRKSFTLAESDGHRILDVDAITGSIEVVGGQGDQVQLVMNETFRAESKERMEKARKEVTLDISQETGLLKLFVNGPFRCNCNDDCHHSRGEDGYSVRTDFQLQVPQNVELKLKTVNGGHVQVKDVTGNFLVRNVNGGIEMQNVAGSGHARTVNGGVKVSFRENPRENSDFSTINGNVDLYFAKNLAADFRFKTMNGGVFTDFPMTSLPVNQGQGERHNGKFVFRTDRFTGGRVGSGGPEIKAENLNGSIRIMERQ
jgi:hypothetical protein